MQTSELCERNVNDPNAVACARIRFSYCTIQSIPTLIPIEIRMQITSDLKKVAPDAMRRIPKSDQRVSQFTMQQTIARVSIGERKRNFRGE